MNTSNSSFLTFRLGEETFAVEVEHVREILDFADITRVPTAASCMLGVVNVRGTATPVIDLRLKFGLPPEKHTIDSRIMVMEMEFEDGVAAIGGLADSVHEVVDFDNSQIAESPKIGMKWRSDFIRGIGTHNGRFIIILNMLRILDSEEKVLSRTSAEEGVVNAP